VNKYYKLSPPIAQHIESSDWKRAIVRLLLVPVVVLAGAAIGNVGYSGVVMLLLVGAVFLTYRRFKRRLCNA
jgi:hypothetical protein